MKRYLLYLLPLLLICLEACSTKSDNTPIPAPLGAFNGKFKLLVKKTTGTGYDTVKSANLLINITSPDKFTVTGDTATVHAGSKGLFQYDRNYIAFLDNTYKVGVQPKFHLVGTYQYAYTGAQLRILRTNLAQDSVLLYDFNKISN